jgi:hypothetical protein
VRSYGPHRAPHRSAEGACSDCGESGGDQLQPGLRLPEGESLAATRTSRFALLVVLNSQSSFLSQAVSTSTRLRNETIQKPRRSGGSNYNIMIYVASHYDLRQRLGINGFRRTIYPFRIVSKRWFFPRRCAAENSDLIEAWRVAAISSGSAIHEAYLPTESFCPFPRRVTDTCLRRVYGVNWLAVRI